MVSFSQFVEAWQAFENDLGLVGHPNDPKMSIFLKPRQKGKYNLALLPKDLNEIQVKQKLKKIKVIAVTCMDKRMVWDFYTLVGRGCESEEVLLITVGGGIVQNGSKRREAMKNILSFLSENTPNLDQVIVSDHDCRYNAVAFWLKAKKDKLPKGFGSKPDCKCEKGVMQSLIAEGYISLVPQVWKDQGKAKVCLVTPAKEKASCQLFDPYLVEAKQVKDYS